MALPPEEIGRRLRLVREEVGIPIEDLAAACGITTTQYAQLESGTLDPLPGDYILIAARILKSDFRYFISEVLDELEKETHQVFRALDAPKPGDLLAIRRFMLFAMAESDLEQLLGITRPGLPPVYPLPGSKEFLHKDQGKQAAIEERQRLLLGNLPIPNVFETIRKQGIRLSRHALEDGNLSGVTVAHPSAGVSVLINFDDDIYRQFFSAAHEYGHVLFDRNAIARDGCVVSYRYSKTELIEIRANSFAAEFLLPRAALSKYPKPHSLEELKTVIAQIARDYRVNTDIVAIRTREIGWITDKTLSSFRRVKPTIIGRKEKHDPDVPLNLAEAQANRYEAIAKQGINAYYLELLRKGLTEDAITFGRFAEMLDMTLEEAQDFVQATGIAI